MPLFVCFFISSFLPLSPEDQTLDQTVTPSLSDETYQQVISLLKLVQVSCLRNPEATALYLDEMASLIHSGHLHPKIEVSVCPKVIISVHP